MSDEAKFTQADLDAAIAPLKDKLAEVMDEAKDAKRKLRAASEIKPEDLTAAEDRADKLAADLANANKALKTLTTERDGAVKALEAESGAARKFALEAELATAIAEGNVVPALVPAFKAMIAQQAKADLVDGQYVVNIGDKSAKDHIKAFLDSDDGKAFRAAPANGGGGASGGKGSGETGKTMSRDAFNGLDPMAQASFVRDGGRPVDQAA